MTGTPAMNDIGSYGQITITVTDTFGAFASRPFSLEVVDPKEVDKFAVLPAVNLLLVGEK